MITKEWIEDIELSKADLLDQIERFIPDIPTRERHLVRPGRKLKLIKSLLDIPEVERYYYPLMLLIQEFLEDRYSINFSDPVSLEDSIGDNLALWEVMETFCSLRNLVEPFASSKDSTSELTTQDARKIKEMLLELLSRMSGRVTEEDDLNEEPLLDSDLHHYYEADEA